MTYQILKATVCRVGHHVWLWTGSSTHPDSELHPLARCDCGRWTWADAKDIREAVEAVSKDGQPAGGAGS